MSKNRRKPLTQSGEWGKSPIRLLLIFGLLAGIGAAVLVAVLNSPGGNGNTAFAVQDPASCDPTIGSGSGFIQASPSGSRHQTACSRMSAPSRRSRLARLRRSVRIRWTTS